MRAGAERAPGVDHDRGRVRRSLVPGRTHPERPHPDRMVERLPAVPPVRGDVLSAHASERVPETFLAPRVGVRDKLDPVDPIHLLEALGKELEHLGPCFFDALGRDCDRDASQDVQRKALFSLSKNPSLAR